MRRKGADEDQYRISKRQFGDREDEDQWRERRNGGRRQDGGRRQHENTRQNRPKNEMDFGSQLLDYIKPGGCLKTKHPKNIKEEIPTQSRKTTEPRLGKLYQPKYEGVKEALDNQLEQYHRCRPESKIAEEKGEKKQRRQGPRRDSNDQDHRRGKRGPQRQDRSDDSDWVQNDAGEEKERQDLSESNWLDENSKILGDNTDQLKNDKEDKSTSSTNIRNQILREEEFPEINEQNNKVLGNGEGQVAPVKRGRRGSRRSPIKQITADKKMDGSSSDSSEEVQPLHSSSLNNGCLGFDSNQLSSLINNQNLLEDEEILVQPRKEQEKLMMSEQQLREKLESFEKETFATVFLKFQTEENVLEVKLREIQLVQLGVTLKIHSNGKVVLKGYPEITTEEIQKYVKVKTFSHYYPRILVDQPENIANLVEGDEENEPQKRGSCVELQLCQMRWGQGVKTGDKMLEVRLVVVRCMQCQTKNEIIQFNNSVIGSCHNCSSKILGKITSICINQQ